MYSETLCPGNWPPSPGFAPCAILICNWSALARYSAVTPNRPEATCLIAERRLSPSFSGISTSMRLAPITLAIVSPAPTFSKRFGSSPPSPVFDLPPMRFMAMASVACASVEIEPSDIAPVAKRLTISLADSTSSSGTGGAAGLSSNSPRKVMCRRVWSLISLAYSLYVSYLPERVACCSLAITSGVHMWSSPRTRKAYSPPASSMVDSTWSGEKAARCTRTASSATSAKPIPSICVEVPVK